MDGAEGLGSGMGHAASALAPFNFLYFAIPQSKGALETAFFFLSLSHLP